MSNLARRRIRSSERIALGAACAESAHAHAMVADVIRSLRPALVAIQCGDADAADRLIAATLGDLASAVSALESTATCLERLAAQLRPGR